MDKTSLIVGSIMSAMCLFISVLGFYMIAAWDKRVAEWKKHPSSDEYMGAIGQGWGGFMLATIGVWGFIVTFIGSIISLVRVIKG